jgi:hypothetical protein
MSEEFVEDIISATPANDVTVKTEVAPTLDKVNENQDVVPVVGTTKVDANKSIEEIATQLGWRADHTGEDSVDAATYILRSKDIQKSMSKHNKDLKDQLSVLNGSVEALKTHNEKVYQAEVKKLQAEITDLKKERKAAIELADVDKVEELDNQIADIQKDLDKPKEEKPVGNARNDVYETWVKDNDWYLNDPEMATFADTVAQNYVGAPLERIYSLVRKKVEEVFPEKFASNKADADTKLGEAKPIGPPSPVERSTNKGGSTNFTKADLTQEQVAIMKQFASSGVMTEEQYVNDIAKMQG